MSRFMQLTVEVRPHYPRGFAESYPKLARYLEAILPGLLSPEPSLLDLCQRLDELLDRLEGTGLGELLESQANGLRRCADGVARLAADWKLAEADKLLYEIEDHFQTIEEELGRGE